MKKLLFAAAITALSSTAQASPYAGIGAGVSKIDDFDCEGATTCDDSGTAVKLYGGWSFTPNIAGEVVYLNFGKARAADAGATASAKAHGFGGGLALHLPFAQSWNFTARAGIVSMRAKGEATVGGASGSISESKAKAYGGLGVGYWFTPALSLNAEYDFSKAELEGEKSDVSMFTLGLRFKF